MKLTLLVIETMLLLVFALVISFLMMFKPEKLWELKHRFFVKGGEPTEFYLVCSRIGGVILLFASVGFGIWVMGQIVRILV